MHLSGKTALAKITLRPPSNQHLAVWTSPERRTIQQQSAVKLEQCAVNVTIHKKALTQGRTDHFSLIPFIRGRHL